MKKLLLTAAVLFGLLVVLVLGCVFLPKYSDHALTESVSPKGQYRIVTIRPNIFGFYHYNDKASPAFVRLFNNKTGELLGESDIVDILGNGRVSWSEHDAEYIMVGDSIKFLAKPE